LNFVNMTTNYKNYILQNLLVLKMLYDRGVNVKRGYDEITVMKLLQYMFGEGVILEEADIVLPDGIELAPEPDSEEEFLLAEFARRPQYIFKVPVPFTCSPDEKEELMAVLRKAVLSGEDAIFMGDCFLLKATIEGKNVNMRFVDYYPETNIDDEGVNILFLSESLIEFWDKVAQIAERRRIKNGINQLKTAS